MEEAVERTDERVQVKTVFEEEDETRLDCSSTMTPDSGKENRHVAETNVPPLEYDRMVRQCVTEVQNLKQQLEMQMQKNEETRVQDQERQRQLLELQENVLRQVKHVQGGATSALEQELLRQQGIVRQYSEEKKAVEEEARLEKELLHSKIRDLTQELE